MPKPSYEAEKEALEKSIAEKQKLLEVLKKEDNDSAKKLVEGLEKEIRQAKGRLDAVKLLIDAKDAGEKIRNAVDSSVAFVKRLGEAMGNRLDDILEELKKGDNKK